MGRYKKKKPTGLVQTVIREALEEGEEYAIVTQVYGGSRCEVKLPTGDKCMCVIRNKFRGRGRRDNFIKVGVWVLIGRRDWERPKADKPQTVDLLFVYTQNDRSFLSSKYPDVANLLTKLDPNYYAASVKGEDMEGVVFSTEEEERKDVDLADKPPDQQKEGSLISCDTDVINVADI